MRIVYTIESKSVHNQRFIQKFIERGYDLYIINFAYEKYDEIAGAHVINRKRLFARVPKVRGIIQRLTPFLDVAFLKKQLNEIRPDVLHGGWAQKDGFYCAQTNFHPYLFMAWGSDILIHPTKSRSARKRAELAIKNADMITCDAEYVKKRIMKIHPFDPGKIIVFPWGIDLSTFNPSHDRRAIRDKLGVGDDLIVLVTRSLEKIYGIEYLMNAIPSVLAKHPSAKFVFCGGGTLTGFCQEFVKNNKLEGKVFLVGAVKNTDLPLYLCAADVWVSPSLSDGTPVSLLEAMACGLPLVVTDNAPVLEWVTDSVNGLVIPKQDAGAIAGAVSRLLADGGMRERFRNENIRIAKERADWEKNFTKLEGMFKALCPGKKLPSEK